VAHGPKAWANAFTAMPVYQPPRDPPTSLCRELADEGALRPAVELTKGVQGVEVAVQLGEPAHEVIARPAGEQPQLRKRLKTSPE